MKKPDIAWLPVRHINDIVEGRMAVEAWLRQVPAFGLKGVEIYHGFISHNNLKSIKELLRSLQLSVSQLTCAPDFTNPNPAERKQQMSDMREKIQIAAELGATAARTTDGMVHEGLTEEDGIAYAVEGLTELAEFAEPYGVKVCYENHYKDRRWQREDFSFRPERFLKIFERIEPTKVMINFDFANPLMTGADPAALLQRVQHKVFHVHAGDRHPGEYLHCVLGTGKVPFDSLLPILKELPYEGWLTIEDGQQEGDEGFSRSIQFLSSKIDQYWS
ncbi:MAG: sugar phosphate isomerase/epimerase [Fimbriimonadia bacterium]|nr:sugar phosphate isomerase/epimerase [Fimbriimonadia bacterium]